MENLSKEIENLNGHIEDSIIESNKKYIKTGKDTNLENDTKVEKDNAFMKPEDLDGLQMLRLALEDNKTLLRKDIVPKLEELIDQQTYFEDPTIISSTKGDDLNHEVKCFQIPKTIVGFHVSQDNDALEETKPLEKKDDIDRSSNFEIKKFENHKGKEGAPIELRKPALVKKKVNNLHGLTERQQKLLQDFHVKFAIEGVDVEEDDETRANRHLEFIELKKRLEEEEKMYAGCALGEASNIDQIDSDLSTILPQELTQISTENTNSLDPMHVAIKAPIDGMINSFAEIAICHQDSSSQKDIKPLLQPLNTRYAMKGLANNNGFSELQEYTNREGSPGCQV